MIMPLIMSCHTFVIIHCLITSLVMFSSVATSDSVISEIDWHNLVCQLPQNHTDGVAAIYNDYLFAIGGNEGYNISIISLSDLNNNNCNDNWILSQWYFNESLEIFSGTHLIANQFSSVAVDSLLYMMGHPYFYLLIYDLSSHEPKYNNYNLYNYTYPSYTIYRGAHPNNYYYGTCVTSNKTHMH